jgi:hypothetical protein
VPDTSTARTIRRSDHELQLVRRIDWRFLLPEPYLRRVAYFGSEQGALPTALKFFSETFRANSAAENGSFDLVVLHLSDVSSLTKAGTLLAPGGFLYWEMKSIGWGAFWRSIKRRKPRASAAAGTNANGLATAPRQGAGPHRNAARLFDDHVAALKHLGFGNIEMHWQRPSFEACLEIIPMNDPVGLDYAFSRPRSDWASRLKFATGRLMMQTGLLAHVTPCFSLMARK